MAMPSREEAIRILEEGHRAVRSLVGDLSMDDWLRPATIGGGDWSAKDLLGHLAEWERYALEALDAWGRGERPWVEDVFDAKAVDRLNDEAVARNRDVPLDEMRARAAEVHDRLVAAIRDTSDEEWSRRAPYPTRRRTRLGALLGSITGAPREPFAHASAHLPDLEAYVASLRTSS